MTKRQSKNRKRIIRLVELCLSHSTGKKTKPLKVGIPDDRYRISPSENWRLALVHYMQQGVLCAVSALLPCVNSRWRPFNLNGQPCGEVTPQEQKEAETV